ncbi:MAG: alkaline phosphatase family protein [Gemmatimonadales bacterium]|nr:MAG: alkaline phosphatase family protein [Gemmatimonadales bacterium]
MREFCSMSKRVASLASAMLVLALAACGGPQPRVMIISIDGLWARDLERLDSAGVETPVLDSLRRAGALAEGVIGSFPSVTYPSHTTMVTGVPPRIHGVYSNVRVYDPLDTAHARDWYWRADWIRVPTLMDLAHEAGLKVGAVFWPVTADDPSIDYNVPEIWDPAGQRSQLSLLRERGTPWLLDSLGVPQEGELTDSLRAAIAIEIVRRWDPDLMLVHLIEVDAAKHRHGPAGDSVWAAIREADHRIGMLLAALRQTNRRRPTTVIVTSDHGFYGYRRVLRPGVLLARAGLVRLDSRGNVTSWDGAVLPSGGSAALITREPQDTAAARRLRAAIPAALIGPDKPVRAVWPPDSIAALGGDPRASWAIVMNEGFYLAGGYSGPLEEERSGGGHGYDPRDPALHAFLLAAGPGIAPNSTLPLVRQTDLAPTVAKILRLAPAEVEGKALF